MFYLVFEELEVVASASLWVRVRCSCGTREEFTGSSSRVLVGVAIPSDLAGSILVEILHCGERRDIE